MSVNEKLRIYIQSTIELYNIFTINGYMYSQSFEIPVHVFKTKCIIITHTIT